MTKVYAVQMYQGQPAGTLFSFTRDTPELAQVAFNEYFPDAAARNIVMRDQPAFPNDLPRSR